MPTRAPTTCCEAIPYLIEELMQCYAQLGDSANPLLRILAAFFQCDGILETCYLTGEDGELIYSNHTEIISGNITETQLVLSGLCCTWRDEFYQLIEDCHSLLLFDEWRESWSNNTNATCGQEEVQQIRECYQDL